MLESKLSRIPRALLDPSISRERTLRNRGAYVHQQGSDATGVSIITEGRAFRMHHSQYATRVNGEGRIVDIYGSGDVVGLYACLGQGKHIDTVRVQTEFLAMRTIDRETFNRIRLQALNNVEAFVEREIAAGAVRDLEISTRLALFSPELRIALLLADLAERFGTPAGSRAVVQDGARQMVGHLDNRDRGELVLDIGLLQEEIAQMVGCSREHVSRVFKGLIGTGSVRNGQARGSYVVDVNKIRQSQA